MKSLLRYSIAAILLFASTVSFAQTSQFKVIGYFPSWSDMDKDIANLDCSKLTHINWAFKIPDSLGNFTGEDKGMKEVVAKAHASNVKVLVSLGGGSASGGKNRANWFNLISTPANRKMFIGKIMDYVAKNDLQGVDVDYEGGAINKDYDPFIIELSQALKPKGLLLTAALSGYGGDKFLDSTLPYFDWINIMSYDYTGSWTPDNPGQHASYDYAVWGIDKWMARGAKREQIIVGLPFYAHAFKTDIKYDYKNYNEIIKSFPDAPKKDYLGDFVWHNGIPTIKRKTNLAIDKAAGVMIWALNYDTYDENSLLKAVDEVVKQRKP
jgi:chitinase